MTTRRDLGSLFAGMILAAGLVGPALAAEDTLPDSLERPDGFPQRPLSMIVPYGPGGGSGQVARAMAQAVTDVTGVSITPDYKPGRQRHCRSRRLHGGPG